MSRPDQSRHPPGHDAPHDRPHGADRSQAWPGDGAGRATSGPAAGSAAPAAGAPAAAGAPLPHATPPAPPGTETPAAADNGDWDDWERELAERAGAPADSHAADHDHADVDGEHGGPAPDESHLQRVRIDKWLWAARFYRTRSLAKEAIEGGKVHCEGQRVKVSKDIKVGMTLDLRQGFDEKTVVVKALSEVRGPASVAQKLYEETADSVAAREQLQANRRAQNLAHPDHRPNKKDRRQIHRFKDSWSE